MPDLTLAGRRRPKVTRARDSLTNMRAVEPNLAAAETEVEATGERFTGGLQVGQPYVSSIVDHLAPQPPYFGRKNYELVTSGAVWT